MKMQYSALMPLSRSAVAQSSINGQTITFAGHRFAFPQLDPTGYDPGQPVEITIEASFPAPVTGDEWATYEARVQEAAGVLSIRLSSWLPPISGGADARLGMTVRLANATPEAGENGQLVPQTTSSMPVCARVFEPNIPLDVLAASESDDDLAIVLEILPELNWPTVLGERLRAVWRMLETVAGETGTKRLASWCANYASNLNNFESGWSVDPTWWEDAIKLRHRFSHADKHAYAYTEATQLSPAEFHKTGKLISLAQRAGEMYLDDKVSSHTARVPAPLP
jgi:hypothetical protein